MGNCFKSSKIGSENAEYVQQNEAEMIKETTRSAKLLESSKHVDGGKRKMVRFRLNEESDIVDKDGDGEVKSGATRIRIVVTRQELKQILNYEKGSKYSSVEQLVSALRLRERRIVDVGSSDGGINGSWKPALGCIPEDH